MGLTVHFSFSTAVGPDAARDLVSQLLDYARELDFDRICDLREIRLNEPDNARRDEQLLSRHFRGWHYLFRSAPNGENECLSIAPLHVVQFMASIQGSEPVIIGLASHPPVVERERLGETEIIETGLAGRYTWQWFCKTQYAGLPQNGGPANFRRAHLELIKLLDKANELGILASVNDEGGYWEDRDEEALMKNVGQYDRIIAAFAGRLKDQFGDDDPDAIRAPIIEHPAFEHLEAEGLDELARMRRRHDPEANEPDQHG
jgi:hypothetical protein